MLQSVRWAHGHFQLINTEYLVHLVAFTQVFIDWQTAIFAKHFCANNAILSWKFTELQNLKYKIYQVQNFMQFIMDQPVIYSYWAVFLLKL